MKTEQNKGLIPKRTPAQWKLHQQIAAFARELDRLPEAQEVRQQQPRSAPLSLLPMIF